MFSKEVEKILINKNTSGGIYFVQIHQGVTREEAEKIYRSWRNKYMKTLIYKEV